MNFRLSGTLKDSWGGDVTDYKGTYKRGLKQHFYSALHQTSQETMGCTSITSCSHLAH